MFDVPPKELVIGGSAQLLTYRERAIGGVCSHSKTKHGDHLHWKEDNDLVQTLMNPRWLLA